MLHIEPELGTFRIRARLLHRALGARHDRTVGPVAVYATPPRPVLRGSQARVGKGSPPASVEPPRRAWR
jgi:hypothetical protein